MECWVYVISLNEASRSEGLARTECSLVECWAFVGDRAWDVVGIMEGCPEYDGDIPLSLSFVP